jgi:Icc-related predicted phosphoesterase
MRIVAFGDIHGNTTNIGPVYTQTEEADVAIVVGDITTFGTPKAAEKLVREIQQHSDTLLAIAGNCDSQSINDKLDAMGIGLHGKGHLVQGVGFFGVSGSNKTPLYTPLEWEDSAIEGILQQGWQAIQDAPCKVLVSHAPPYSTKLDLIRSGDHVGSKALRTFIEQQQPNLVLCGHIHESPGEDQLGKTKMVNLGMAGKGYYAVIDLLEEITIHQFGV